MTLHLDTEAGGGAVADNDRLLQVVSNLVENAIRCTPAPGTVMITTAPGAVTVADTGRGLTSDDLPRAFERFYLYSRYGTDRPVGTGLGLAIVKELTEAMGGTMSVSSAVGVGTAFTVALRDRGVLRRSSSGRRMTRTAPAPAAPACRLRCTKRDDRDGFATPAADPTCRTMRRDRGRRRIYRSRALRRRRSVFVLCVLAALAGIVVAAGKAAAANG